MRDSHSWRMVNSNSDRTLLKIHFMVGKSQLGMGEPWLLGYPYAGSAKVKVVKMRGHKGLDPTEPQKMMGIGRARRPSWRCLV